MPKFTLDNGKTYSTEVLAAHLRAEAKARKDQAETIGRVMSGVTMPVEKLEKTAAEIGMHAGMAAAYTRMADFFEGKRDGV